MHRLSSPSRPLLSFMASAPLRWWPPALARRVFPLTAAPNPPVRRVSPSPHGSRNMASSSGVKGDESGKPDRRLLIFSANEHSAVTQGMKNVETRGTTKEFIARYGDGRPAHGEEDERRTSMDVIYGDEDACRTTLEVIDGKRDTWGKIVDISGCEEDGRSATKDHRGEIVVSDDGEHASCDAQMPRYPIDGVVPMDILPNSSHRDGSIYRGTDIWKKDYRIADRNETRLEAMMLSDPTDCVIRNGTCMLHLPSRMLQIFSLKLAKIPVDGGTVELYGYIAARDDLDPLLNYVVKFSRDDPIIVEQGSLINMAGPKRGIDLYGTILIEYDMRIKTGEQEKDDLQLIDGVSVIDDMDTWNCHVFTNRIHGDCGVIDMTVSRLEHAVEATVEVLISEVQSSFNLCLGCFISGLNEEIRLFNGAIGESRGLKRSVVAVVMGSCMDLKFKVGAESSSSAEHCCSFKANNHGLATQEIKTDFALISVKVTWSTLPAGH